MWKKLFYRNPIKSDQSIAEMLTLEWYHAMFLMQGMIFMHSTPSSMLKYVAIIAGKDRNPNKIRIIEHKSGTNLAGL